MGCIKRCIYCLIGPYPCCICCVRSRESTTTRLMYMINLIVFTSVSVYLCIDINISAFEDARSGARSMFCYVFGKEDCSRLFGYLGIYRICLSFSIYHFLFAIFTIGVSSSRSVRGKIHNGFWFIKIILLASLWISFYFTKLIENYTLGWTLLGMFGAIIFVFIQYVVLIDRLYELNIAWEHKMNGSTCYKFLVSLVSFLIYMGSFGIYGTYWYYFGFLNKCVLNMAMVSVNASFTFIFAICSVAASWLREHHTWLPGSLISLLASVLSLAALASQPKNISTDVPWIKNTSANRSRPMKSLEPDASVSPIMIAADELRRLVNDGQVQEDVSVLAPRSVPNGTFANPCISQSHDFLMSSQLLSELLNFGILVFLVAHMLFSSVSATQQSHRFGIQTKRNRLKRIFNRHAISTTGDTPIPTEQQMTQNEVANVDEHRDQEQTEHQTPQAKVLKKRRKNFRFSTRRMERRILRKLEMINSNNLPNGADDTVEAQPPTNDPQGQECEQASSSQAGGAQPPDGFNYRNIILASDLAVKPSTEYVLSRRPELINRFAFLQPMLSTAAPADRYLKYTDAVAPAYSYSWFHLVLAVTMLKLMVSLTNWYSPEQAAFSTFAGSWSNFYTKMAVVWLLLLLYSWTIVVPYMCRHHSKRDVV